MLKINYKTTLFFSLKKYEDSGLNARTFYYPTINTIKGAILSSIIELDGVEKAKELFPRVKNATIYIQYNSCFKQSIKVRRISNKVIEKWNKEGTKFNSVPAIREMGQMEDGNICFYMTNTIPDLEVYLKNIDYIGTSNSFVYLDSIQEVKSMENILMEWDKKSEEPLHEMYDWDSRVNFEDIYLYSRKASHRGNKYMCAVKELVEL